MDGEVFQKVVGEVLVEDKAQVEEEVLVKDGVEEALLVLVDGMVHHHIVMHPVGEVEKAFKSMIHKFKKKES